MKRKRNRSALPRNPTHSSQTMRTPLYLAAFLCATAGATPEATNTLTIRDLTGRMYSNVTVRATSAGLVWSIPSSGGSLSWTAGSIPATNLCSPSMSGFQESAAWSHRRVNFGSLAWENSPSSSTRGAI